MERNRFRFHGSSTFSDHAHTFRHDDPDVFSAPRKKKNHESPSLSEENAFVANCKVQYLSFTVCRTIYGSECLKPFQAASAAFLIFTLPNTFREIKLKTPSIIIEVRLLQYFHFQPIQFHDIVFVKLPSFREVPHC